MPLTTLGDMATSLTFLRHSTALKMQIERLGSELASGTVADIHGRLGGNYAYLSDIGSRYRVLEGYSVAASEAGTAAAAMQASLSQVQAGALGLSSTLLAAQTGTAHATQSTGSAEARETLDMIVTSLNMSVAGRTLFSGSATRITPLAGAETLLDELRLALAGLTDAEDIRVAAGDWFGPGGGFETTVYRGGTTEPEPVRISETRQVDLGLRADDPALRDLMRETALAALADDPVLGLAPETASALRRGAGEGLLAINDALTHLRAGLGHSEARIEETAAGLSASRLALEEARARLLAADPFETAARLEDAQARLETLFAVTARNAALKLVNHL